MQSLININEARGLAIVLMAALVDVWLAYSGPRSIDLLSLILLLGGLASLAVFFVGILRISLPNPTTRWAALLAVVLLGLHPSNTQLLGSPTDIKVLISFLGILLGFVFYQRKFEGLLGWVYLAPVAAAALCDRMALGFALLLLAYKLLFEESPSWSAVRRSLVQCVPAAMVSLLAVVKPTALDSAAPWAPGTAIHALLAFADPIQSLTEPLPRAIEAGTLAALLGIGAYASWRGATRPLAFGMAWFLVMLFAAPNQFLPAYAGLALVTAWVIAQILQIARTHRWLVTAGFAVLLAACGTAATQKNDKSAPAQAGSLSVTPSADSLVSSTMTAEQWLNLSLYAYQHGRYLESIAAAQTALKLKPDYADAYNNIAAAYSALHLWDLAIAAAQEALRLKPDFPLARNNLNWALEQKRLAAH